MSACRCTASACMTVFAHRCACKDRQLTCSSSINKKQVLFCRWFHFRLSGVQNQALIVKLVNAGESSFPEAWPGYKACASYDLKEWFRVQTAWDEKAGVITMQHESNHVRPHGVSAVCIQVFMACHAVRTAAPAISVMSNLIMQNNGLQ